VNAREYIGLVKSMPCSVCGADGPSDAHHPRTGAGMGQRNPDWTAISLCKNCHQGDRGIHGDRSMWKVFKIDEMGALARTIENVVKHLANR
jgi:hypothetical protein